MTTSPPPAPARPDEQPELDGLTPVPSAAEISGAVEALLLLAEEPMRPAELAEAIGVPEDVVVECLAGLVAFYDETGRGFELRPIGGGWRYYTRAEHADLIARHVLEGRESKLSQAGLETLAVIAYHQPISRARVSAVRGVSVDGVIRTLVGRGLIEESGHDHESGAVVFATTSFFLDRMGLRSLADLPPLAPHLPEVEELEAELSQLAGGAPGAFPRQDEPPPDPGPADPGPADPSPADHSPTDPSPTDPSPTDHHQPDTTEHGQPQEPADE